MSTKSPFSHGSSEIWERTAVSRATERLCSQMAHRLRELRLGRGISQERASEMIGIHPKHLQRLERGSANVTVATLAAVSLAYEVPIKDLFEPALRPNPSGRAPRIDSRAKSKKAERPQSRPKKNSRR